MKIKLELGLVLLLSVLGCTEKSKQIRNDQETYYYANSLNDSIRMYEKRTYFFHGDTVVEKSFLYESKDSLIFDIERKYIIMDNKIVWFISDDRKFDYLSLKKDDCMEIKEFPNFDFENCTLDFNDSIIIYTSRENEIDGITKKEIRDTNFVLEESQVLNGIVKFDKTRRIEEDDLWVTQ
jgi:hypothetical protein